MKKSICSIFVFLMIGLMGSLSIPSESNASIFITGSGGGADARIGTITNGKWCSASAGVIVCTEDAPAGAGDVTAVGDCSANDCFDGSAGQGTYISFYDGNSHWTKIKAGDSTANLTFTFPTAYPAGASYLVNSTTGGALGFTDPASFATAAHNHDTTYTALATYNAHTVLAATTDNTPAALTITEQTVLGRATGGNIAALAIDADIAGGVSENDDTIPSAKAMKAYADLMVLKSLFDANTVLYATTDNTPAALSVTEQTVVGRGTGGAISALAIDSDIAGGVSENDDTIPSAKAMKAYADLMVPKTTYDAYSVLYADTDNTPAALSLSASNLVGRGSSGGVAAITLGSGLSIASAVLSVNIHGTTEETTIADDDEVIIYDTSESVIRRMTRGNFLYGIGGEGGVILDLADDGSNESTSIAEIAIVNDNAGAAAIFTEPSADKFKIDVGKYWPTASAALTGDSATSFFSTGTLELAVGGTGLSTVAAGSILAANSADTLSAVTSASGLKVLQNNAGTVSWATVTGTGSPVLGTAPSFTTSIAAVTAGGATVGTAALPFSSVFIGDAATNNIQLTGTAASAKVVTLPGQTGTVTVAPTTTTAGQIFLGTTTAGLGQWSSAVLGTTTNVTSLTNGTSSFTIPAGASFTTSGAYGITLTSTGTTDVTLPTSGTLYGTATGSITSANLLGSLTNETGTGVAVFGTSPSFTTSILPASAGGATIGSATYEWGNVYLTDSAVIYAQANQGNTLTSAATGWTANLEFAARSFVPTAAADANGEFGYASNAFSWYANSESAILTAGSNLFTFSSGTSATFAFTPSVLFTGGATFSAAATPTTNDAAALGSSSLMWSDLFLASGGVLNWNNGDVTATHSSNALAFAGASSGYTFDAPVTITGAILPGTANTYALGSATAELSDLFLGDGAVIYGQNDQSATLTSSSGKWTANALDITGASTIGTISAGAGGFVVDADGDTTVKTLNVSGATGYPGYARTLEDPAYGINYRGWSMKSATDYTTDFTVDWPGGDPSANQFIFLHAPSGGVIASTYGSFGTEFTVTANTVNLTTGGVGIAKINATGTPSGSTALYGDGSWKAVTAAASGSDGYVQIASSGALSSDAGLAFNATTQRLAIGKSGTTGGISLLAETGATDYTTTLLPSASAAANLSTTLWASALVTGDTVIASGNNQLGAVSAVALGSVFTSKGTTTAPAWDNAPQITSINLGHASDTTLTRVSAGVAAIEGVTLATIGANTFTGAQTFSTGGSFNATSSDSSIPMQVGTGTASSVTAAGRMYFESDTEILTIGDGATSISLDMAPNVVYTFPSVTSTLATLGANTFTGAQTVGNDASIVFSGTGLFNATSAASSIPWSVGSATASNTAEGTAYWESDTDMLTIGDGATGVGLDFTAGQTYTFPTGSCTLAGRGLANTFTQLQTFSLNILVGNGATGAGAVGFAEDSDNGTDYSSITGRADAGTYPGFVFGGSQGSEDLVLNASADTWTFSTTSGVTKMDFSGLNLVTTGAIQGGISISSDADGMDAAAMTSAGMYGTMFVATGAGTWILPRAALGMSACLMDSGTAHDLILGVTAGSTIRLKGTEQTDGVGITNASGTSTGDFICVIAVATDKWSTVGMQGTWASQ